MDSREQHLSFGPGIAEQTLNIADIVFNDNISETEEVFVIYTDATESSDDICATLVYILDNDCE